MMMPFMGSKVHIFYRFLIFAWITVLMNLPVKGSPRRVPGLRAQADSPNPNSERELWLEDFTKDFLYEMQADGVIDPTSRDVGSSRVCPPIPEVGESPPNCVVTPCQSDKQCSVPNHRCCFNGCVFTCQPSIPPPSLVDWWHEPPRRLQTGNSWLIPGEDEDENVEPCSTSEMLDADEDALLCPHGYICHIEYAGDPVEGVPNRGRCVQEPNYHPDAGRRFRLPNEATKGGICIFEKAELSNGATFWYDKHPCICDDGDIVCRVGQPRRRSRH